MTSGEAILDVANKLLTPKGLKATTYEILQNLWAGYGHIARLQVEPIDGIVSQTPDDRHAKQSLILKIVTPPYQNGKNERQVDEGHLRKLISYQVEQRFYTNFAPDLPLSLAPVASCVASISETSNAAEPTIAMILTDLREKFPVEGEKRGELNETQVYAALRWLAGFHGFWWQRTGSIDRKEMRLPPLEEATVNGEHRRDGLWLNGGYTYLATRQKEYKSLREDTSSEWSSALCTPVPESETGLSMAELVAQILSPSVHSSPSSPIQQYETLIHGDVKSENLFTTTSGSKVAFFDFQYVGLGLGVCDLAKLFTCSVPESLLTSQIPSHLDMQEGERQLLEYYRDALEGISGRKYPWEDLVMHWKTAIVDWHRFQVSWGQWGNSEWLEARVRHILRDQKWRECAIKAAEQKS
ncbi:hypothetical protein M409DRAFT_64585 [Zasmidium cellare ATCC 36951]|uniref:Aminoglycoside phosphotransferase domain-containing protein n=1 Tax=Zasmidium cellare ATCC 36951 TaxID=1080233 RepID=A0A6A6CT35_ZASCE|nr:uncharacterized protein M409DRAFT_64585 [Zasmidium cellare ATCC 36951]KAF2170261.1 hypothetical protein M409DRAFT_64585 [Zasmidium cellare ATCC 36951]